MARLIFFLNFFFAASLALAQSYSVEQYLQEVERVNLSLKSKQSELEATELDERKVDLKHAAMMNSTLAHTIDRKASETIVPTYGSMSGTAWQIDFTKQFSSGTKVRGGVELQRSTLYGFSPGVGSVPPNDMTMYRAKPFVEMSQSLWQDAFGRSSRLTRDLFRLQTNAQKSDLDARRATLAAEAKLTYARFAFAKSRKNFTERSLETARQIFRIIENKYRQNLSEKSDLLQAEALLNGRILEHNASLEEESAAVISFNQLLQINAVTTDKQIAPIESLKFLADAAPVDFKVEARRELDVLRSRLEAQKINIETEEDKTKPNLDVFAGYGLNSMQDQFGDSISKLHKPYQPTVSVGLKLSMFLDQDLLQSQVSAARLRASAAELQYQETIKSLERDLATLVSKRSLAGERVKVATDMERVQNAKLSNEKSQYNNGRSTTYQLLMFTQDLANSELSKLQAHYELTLTDIQLSLFR